MKICPNLSNPQVAEQWEELVENLDGSVKAAYQVWSLNKGNMIDKAPNGEPSILFHTLLSIYNGDRKNAIQAKAKLYTKEFINWFGDWTGEYEDEKGENPYTEHSAAVDENGEPKILYHTVGDKYDANFSIFNTHIEGKLTQIYTSDNKYLSESYSEKQQSYKTYDDNRTKPFYANIRKPLIINGNGARWNQLSFITTDTSNITDEDKKYAKDYFDYFEKVLKQFLNENKDVYDEAMRNADYALMNAAANGTEEPDIFDYLDDASQGFILKIVSDKYPKLPSKYAINKHLNYRSLKEKDLPGVNKMIVKSNRHALSTRDIEHLVNNNDLYDGIIFNDIIDIGPYSWSDQLSNVYTVRQSSQLKSIYNNGQFSDDQNFYYNISPRSLIQSIQKKWRNNNDKKGMTKQQAENLQSALFYSFGIFPSVEETNTKGVYNLNSFNYDLATNKDLHDPKNLERDLSSWSDEAIISFAKSLNASFGNMFTVHILTENEWKNKKFSDISNGVIDGTDVYLRKNRMNGQIAAEEMLHTFVYNVAIKNPELFKQLAQSARENFQKLAFEIDSLYTQHKDEELVTQALSRCFTLKYIQNDGKKNKFISWLKKVGQLVFKLFKSVPVFNNIINKYNITVDNMTDKMSFNVLTKLLMSEDVQFIGLTTIPSTRNNISPKNTKPFGEEIYSTLADAISKRDQYIDQIKAQYKKDTGKDMQASQINKAKSSYNKNQLQQSLDQYQQIIASAHKLYMNDGMWMSTRHGKDDTILEFFVNSLNPQTFDRYRTRQSEKYKAFAPIQDPSSAVNMIRQAFEDGDVQTLDKIMARDYVRMMWDSDLIQIGLDMLNSEQKGTSQELETRLVDTITDEKLESRIHNKKIIEYVKTFWQKLNNLVKSLFGKHVYTKEQQSEILTAIQSSMLWNRELEKSEGLQPIYKRAEADYASTLSQTPYDERAISTIIEGTKTRLRAANAKKNKNQSLINKLKSQIENNERINPKDVKQEYNLIVKTIENANKDINSTLLYLSSLDYNNVGSWNAEQLNSIQRDVIGFYSGIMDNIQALFPQNEETALSLYNKYMLAKDPNGIDVQAALNEVQSTINRVRELYRDEVLHRFARFYIDSYIDSQDQLQDKEKLKARADRFLSQDAQYGNLASGEIIVGMASRSKSPVVRIIDSIIQDTEAEKGRIVLATGKKLVDAYNKIRPTGSQISPTNYQKKFMALDRDGVPTGYLINDLNRGQFYIDRDEFISKLNDKYSNKDKYGDAAIDIDDQGNITWNDEDETADKSVYNQYNDELDEWLDKHCIRRYKLEYYKKRRRYLSRYALQLQRQIQRDIAILTQKATVEAEEDGKKFNYIDTSKLTYQELKRLKNLRKQKRDLGSHYIITSDKTGLLHVEEKVGDALKVADEISRWNNFLRDHVKYKPDWKTFNKVKEDVLGKDVDMRLIRLHTAAFIDENKQYTDEQLNAAKQAQKEYNELYDKWKKFMDDNSCYQITPQFWDLLKRSVGHFNDEKLSMLQKRHTELVRALKDKDDLCAPNLYTKAGLGINTDRSMWTELKRIEQAIADRKAELLKEGQHIDGTKEVKFGDIANMANAIVSDQDQQAFLPYLYNQWANAASNNTDLWGTFNDLFTYNGIGKNGQRQVQYLNVFKYLEPRGFKVLDGNGNQIQAIERVPINEYQSLDESSDFVNNELYSKTRADYKGQQFDNNDGHAMQPLYSLYKDKRFDKLNDKEKQFLDLLRSTLNEANSKIPQRALSRDGLLPQITGQKMSLLGRSFTNHKFWSTIGYCIQDIAGKTYAESDKDATTNIDLPRRPDGSIVNNIPIRYVNRLNNRALLSTDVLGSIIEYYNMATNFEQKSKNIDQLELVQQALQAQASKYNVKPQQADKVKNMLTQAYYGKTTSFSFNDDETITTGKARTIQFAKTFRKLATWSMLAANFTTIQVGYFDSLMSAIADAFGGKYITGSDFRYGFIHSMIHFVKMISNIGNPIINDKLSAAMQYNQLSKSNSEIFGQLDQSKISRILDQYFTMGGYTLTDYMINSSVLMSFYHACRLIQLPNGKQEFLNKSEAINRLTKLGYTYKEAENTWKKSKTNLWDAYELKDGLFQVKDQYKNIVTKRVENQMQKKLHDRTAVYNGVVPMSEKAKLQQNIFASYISLMRGFFINTYWDRFNTGVDYANINDDEDVNWKSEYKRDDMGFEDLRTGEFQGALFKDFCRGLSKGLHNMKFALHLAQSKNKLTPNQLYAVKRCGAEITMILGLTASLLGVVLPWCFSGDEDDDKDPVWTLNIFDPEGEDRPLLDVDWSRANNSLKNWMRWKLMLLNTRLINERLTPWLPQTAMDLINSPTTALSYYDNLSMSADLVKDIVTGDINTEIKSGGYKGMSKGTKDVLATFSHIPINNIVKDFHVGGIKSTFNYYRNQSVLPFFIPSMREWKDDQEDSTENSNDQSGFDSDLNLDINSGF